MFSVFLVSIFCTRSFSDCIKFLNGTFQTVQIADTSGCFIVFLSEENLKKLDKNEINFIVKGKDTINYLNFKCTEEIKSKSNINEKQLNLIAPIDFTAQASNHSLHHPLSKDNGIKPNQLAGSIQIILSLIGEGFIIYDANRTYQIGTIEVHNKWEAVHTAVTCLAASTFISGFVTFNLK
jgi:hypothetical protein